MDTEWDGGYEAEAVVPQLKTSKKRARKVVTAADVVSVVDTLLATLTTVIGLLLVADAKVLAPAASGTLLLLVGIIRLIVAADHWLQGCGRRKDEETDEVALVNAQEVTRLTALADAATATADAERAAASERVAAAEHTAEALRSIAAERLAEAEEMTDRLASADVECADLARRLNKTRADLDAAGAQTHLLREAHRRHTARCLRLAARLAVSRRRQRLALAENCANFWRSAVTTTTKDDGRQLLAESPPSPSGMATEQSTPQTPPHSTGLAQKLGTPSTQCSAGMLQENGTPSTAALLREAEPLLSAEAAEELGYKASSPGLSANASPPSFGLDMCASPEPPASAAAEQPASEVPLAASVSAPPPEKGDAGSAAAAAAAASKRELVARLTKMAAGNPELRESLRERLKSTAGANVINGNSTGSAATVAKASSEPGDQAPACERPSSRASSSSGSFVTAGAGCDRSSSPSDAVPAAAPENQSEGPAGSARNEIISRLHGLASANQDLKAEWQARGEELSAATRDAAAMRELAAERARELSHLRARRDALEIQVAEVSAELRASRQFAAAREIFEPASKGPELSFNWVDGGWDWPGGAASSKGAEKLRRSVGNRSAQLSVGPPPVDWRTWLQLGLRRGQPTDPAILKLAVPDAEDGSYIGLMWAVPAA
mmetsp:Transcript_119652/g.211442  ORF Transcript_119652/g.211442 Transcript_119652/m.211442 type:complete len:667 (-) Transcript_119652:142-2142(-)